MEEKPRLGRPRKGLAKKPHAVMSIYIRGEAIASLIDDIVEAKGLRSRSALVNALLERFLIENKLLTETGEPVALGKELKQKRLRKVTIPDGVQRDEQA